MMCAHAQKRSDRMAEKDSCFHAWIVTPDGVFYDGEVTFLELPTISGRIGVYREHIPLTTVLDPGRVEVAGRGEKKAASVGNGFATILKDRVTVLTERAEWEND